MGTLTQEDVTGTTYTTVAGDAGKVKRFTNAAGCAVTVADSTHAAGDVIHLLATDDNTLTLTAGGSLTLRNPDGTPANEARKQWSMVSLYFTGASEAVVTGDTTLSGPDGLGDLTGGNGPGNITGRTISTLASRIKAIPLFLGCTGQDSRVPNPGSASAALGNLALAYWPGGGWVSAEVYCDLAGSVGDTCYGVIYACADDGLPGTLVHSVEFTGLDSTGDKNTTDAYTLAAGWYWWGIFWPGDNTGTPNLRGIFVEGGYMQDRNNTSSRAALRFLSTTGTDATPPSDLTSYTLDINASAGELSGINNPDTFYVMGTSW